MRELRDDALMSRWIEGSGIRGYFDTEGLAFRVYTYENGEMIISPFQSFSELLFIADGKAWIYAVKGDGNITPVNVISKGTVLGDLEYCRKGDFPYYVEAQDTVVCLALEVEPYRQKLDQDVRFLHVLLDSVSDKLLLFTTLETTAENLEGRVILYMQNMCREGVLQGVGDAAMKLRCSRRQLQRVLKKLCDDGKIQKTGKGCYRITDGNGMLNRQA